MNFTFILYSNTRTFWEFIEIKEDYYQPGPLCLFAFLCFVCKVLGVSSPSGSYFSLSVHLLGLSLPNVPLKNMLLKQSFIL